MLLLHESLPLKLKKLYTFPESFMFFSWEDKRLHEVIFNILNRKLYSNAWWFQPRTKREKWWESTCYAEIQNMPALNPTQEGRYIFFLLKCVHFIFNSQSHFHLVTNFPHMQLGEEGWRFPNLNKRVLHRKLICKPEALWEVAQLTVLTIEEVEEQ